MRPTFAAIAHRCQALSERLNQFAFIWRAAPRARVRLWAAGGGILSLAVLGAVWAWHGARPTAPADPETAWRYLLVCQACGFRDRMVAHPANTLPQQAGLLQCPKCGKPAASWYRRGGQALPPGGWSTSLPGSPPAQSAPAAESRP